MPRLDAHDQQLDAPVAARAAPVAVFARPRSPRRSRFTRSPQKMTGRARRAFRESTGPGHRLMDALGSAAYLFTLRPADLDASLSDDPAGLYDETVSDLIAAVARAFHGPVYAVAEVGKGSAPGRRGRLHVHVVAHREDGPAHVRRDTARCTPVYDIFGLYKYLAKPPEPYSLAAETDAAAARVMSRSGRLPNTRRHLLSPERLAWSRSLMPLEPKCPTNPNTEPSEAVHADLPGPVDRSTESSADAPQKPTEPTPRPSDQPAALLNPQPLPKSHMSAIADAPERSVGKTPVHARRLMQGTSERARAPPPRPRRRDNHRRFDPSPKGQTHDRT